MGQRSGFSTKDLTKLNKMYCRGNAGGTTDETTTVTLTRPTTVTRPRPVLNFLGNVLGGR